MKNFPLLMIIPLLMMPYARAHVKVENYCGKSIYVKVHFIGAGSPTKYIVAPGGSDLQRKDLADIKKGYDVWINTGNESDIWKSSDKVTDKAKDLDNGLWKKVISCHGIKDAGAKVTVKVFEHPDPKYQKETLYGLEH